MTLINMLSYKDILDFIYPRICIITEKRLSPSNSNNYAEDAAIAELPALSDELKRELKMKMNANHVLALYPFDESSVVQSLLHHLKYKSMKGLGIYMGELLGKSLLEKFTRTVYQYDYIIPVPLHPVKERERGYNQSVYLCKGIVKHIALPIIPDMVMRVKNTKSQTKLDKKQRADNVFGAFMVNPMHKDKIKDKSFIIVDDVLTTGATINEVISMLKKEGANRIFTVTFAMAEH